MEHRTYPHRAVAIHPLIEIARDNHAAYSRTNDDVLARFWYLEAARRYTKLAHAVKSAGLYFAPIEAQQEFYRTLRLRVRVPSRA